MLQRIFEFAAGLLFGIGLLLSGDLERPVLEADTIVVMDGVITQVGREKDCDTAQPATLIDAMFDSDPLLHYDRSDAPVLIDKFLEDAFEADVDAIVKDFAEKFFGPAAGPMGRYVALMDAFVPGQGAAIVSRYPGSAFGSLTSAAAEALGDALFVCPTRRVARAFAIPIAPTWHIPTPWPRA